MSKRKAFLIVSSALWVLTVLLLAGAVIGLYREGTALQGADPLAWVFTRERMAERLLPILPLAVLCLGLTVAGLVSGVREEKSGPKPLEPDLFVGEKNIRQVRGLRITFLALAAAVTLLQFAMEGKALRGLFPAAAFLLAALGAVGLGVLTGAALMAATREEREHD